MKKPKSVKNKRTKQKAAVKSGLSLHDLSQRAIRSLRISYALFRIRTKVKKQKLLNSLNLRAQEEIVFFNNSRFQLSLKPFLIAQGFVFLFVLFTVASFFIPYQEFDKSSVIQTAVIKQKSTVVAGGSPVRWTALINKSAITKDQYLLSLPKSARNIKVQTISKEEAENIIQSQLQEQVSLSQRQSIAFFNQSRSFLAANLADGFSKLFLSSLEDGVESVVDLVSNDNLVQTIDDSTVVDLSSEIVEPATETVETAEQSVTETPVEEPVETVLTTDTVETPVEAPVATESSASEEIISEIDNVPDAETPATQEPAAEETLTTEVEGGAEDTITENLSSLTETTSPSDGEVINAEESTETAETVETPATVTDEVIAVTYETPAPEIAEQETDNGKLVTVSSDEQVQDPTLEQVPLTDVVAFTTIPEIYKVGQESKIKIKWKNNDNKEVTFKAYDTNNNGKLDYVEWTVPHLSTQTFEIIFISKAFLLDTNKDILEDIYDTVKAQDGAWVSVTNGQYVRVTFEKTLTNKNDITLYVRPTDANATATIQAYTTDTNQLVATFNIDHEGLYKQLIPDLQTPTDLFDLKIIGKVDIDYIVDPADIYTGLVAHWKMNDTNGTTVVDNIGMDNGIGTYTVVTGKVDGSINFNGTSDYINLGDPADLQFSNTNNFSLAFWINWGGSSNSYTSIISKENLYSGYTVLIKDNNRLAVYLSGGASALSMDGLGGQIPTGWHYIVVNCNSAEGITTYIDGVLDYTQSGTYSFGATSENAYIGKSFFANRLLAGSLDDVRIYNRVLSQSDIDLLYNSGNGTEEDGSSSADVTPPVVTIDSPTNGSVNGSSVNFNVSATDETSAVSLVSNLDSSLVSWWRMDDVSGTTLTDYIGDNDGTISGATQTTGKFGQGMSFTGTDNGISFPTPVTNNVTLSTWFKRDIDSGDGVLITYKSVILKVTNTQIIFWPDTNLEPLYASWTQNNNWNNLIVSQQGTSILLYLNGEILNYTGTPVSLNMSGGSTGGIGYWYGVGVWRYNGIVDDFMIFNRALSAEEIKSLYDGTALDYSSTLTEGSHTYKTYAQDLAGNVAASSLATFTVDATAPAVSYDYGTPSDSSVQNTTYANVIATTSDANGQHSVFTDWNNSLVSWWRMDDVVGTTLTDYMGNNDGTISGATQTKGKFGKAFDFSSLGSVSFDYSSSLDFDRTDPFSLSLWLKQASTEGTKPILTNSSCGKGYNLFSNWSAVGFALRNTYGSNMVYVMCDGLSATDWTNIVVSYNGNSMASGIQVYSNGASQSCSVYEDDLTDSIKTSCPITIGNGSYDGLIDDVQIFNRALSSDEIKSLYDASATQYSNTFTGLSDGDYTLKTYAQDLAGNVSTGGLRTFTVDTISPNAPTALTWSETSPYDQTSITASWTKSNSADLANQKIQFYTGDNCNTSSGSLIDLASTTTQTYSFTGSDQTTYTYKITSIDTALNETVSDCSSAMQIVLDNASPTTDVNLNGFTSDTWTSSNVTIDLTCQDVGMGCDKIYTCEDSGSACDPTAGTAYDSPKQFTYTSEGITTLRWKSKDLAGNWQTTEGSAVIKIDRTAPVTTIDAGGYGFNTWLYEDLDVLLTCADAEGSGCTNIYYCVSSSNSCTPDTTYTGTITISEAQQTMYLGYYSVDSASNSEVVNYRSIMFPGPTGGGGAAFSANENPVVETPIVATETTSEPNIVVQVVEQIVEQVTEQTTNTVNQVVELFNGEVSQPEIVYPPIEVAVPEEPQLVFQGEDIISPTEFEKIDILPLPDSIKELAFKFPKFASTLEKVGISAPDDIEKLKVVTLFFPSLSEVAGVPASLSFSDFTENQRKKIPTNITFAKTGADNIDLNIKVDVSDVGEPVQSIATIQNKPLYLTIKPDNPASSVKGYIILQSANSKSAFVDFVDQLSEGLSASLLDAASIKERTDETDNKLPEVTVTKDIVLQEFEYTDVNDIWTAEINAPNVSGNFEVKTVIEYKEPTKDNKTSENISMVLVVDPEGYIYEKTGINQETRVSKATVFIYWLNNETKQFELWPAEDFLQENPQVTDITGKYSFLVPVGTYYLTVESPDYITYIGKPFQVEAGKGVHENIELQVKNWWARIFTIERIMLGIVIVLLAAVFVVLIIKKRVTKK